MTTKSIIICDACDNPILDDETVKVIIGKRDNYALHYCSRDCFYAYIQAKINLLSERELLDVRNISDEYLEKIKGKINAHPKP